jgi:cytochrome c-type biogenesis protein CcmF
VTGSLGNGLVLVALAAGAFGAVVAFGAGASQSARGLLWTKRAVWLFCAAMIAANLAMVYALVTHDFSIKYVAQVGSRATPLVFTVVSLWSALEGSILFWGLILSVYVGLFTFLHADRYREDSPWSLGVMLACGAFFALLIAGPANPWTPVSPAPPDGPGPNPLLQNHVLMVVHPPMLYAGYVGMTVPFGIAIGALLRGRLGDAWMGLLRKWMLVAWTFLSTGIVLGGWWAYAVLGWGGYWAWDPVENASFLPWLTATAFIHSTMVQERRKLLRVWTLSLALASFLLTILGTFMTRSGVFNSVHSFTQSEIGPTFLAFLAVATVASAVLLAGRAQLLVSEGRIEGAFTRETMFLLNNLVFVAFTFTVLLGTVYPMLTEALRGVRVSVGEPYFNRMAVPLGAAILFLMGVGPALPWGRPEPGAVTKTFLIPAGAGIAVAGACAALGLRGFWPLLTFSLAGFATVITLREISLPVRARMSERGEGVGTALVRGVARSRRRVGGYVVHLGVVVIAVAVAASQSYVKHTEATLGRGESLAIGDYRVTYLRQEERSEPHRDAVLAVVKVEKGGRALGEMAPRLNHYHSQREPIGTPEVRSTAKEDLYLTLMAYEQDGSQVTLKAWVFPLVGWIWWGLPILALGSLISLWPRRREPAALSAPVGAVEKA